MSEVLPALLSPSRSIRKSRDMSEQDEVTVHLEKMECIGEYCKDNNNSMDSD